MCSNRQYYVQGGKGSECGGVYGTVYPFGVYCGKRNQAGNPFQNSAINPRYEYWQIRQILQQRKSFSLSHRVHSGDEENMKFDEITNEYERFREKHGRQTYRYISDIFHSIKSVHKRGFRGNDHEQSWRAFKGKNLEKLVKYILERELREIGLCVECGNSLERKREQNLPQHLAYMKRQLLVDYGEFGYHFPDSDIIIYKPENLKVVASVSVKTTLRERVAQTGYWNLKLKDQDLTKVIKVIFISPDEDGTLTIREPAKKGRAIVEIDTDGTYVMSHTQIEESDKVKMFDKLFDDLNGWVNEHNCN